MHNISTWNNQRNNCKKNLNFIQKNNIKLTGIIKIKF
jgi:hypothetical protein